MTREFVCRSIDVEDDRPINVEIDRDWKQVDTALRTLARRRAALDAEEAKWLRAAARLAIWRELGFVSLADYLEHRLGYAPRTAHERIRVALALGALPAMEQALSNGMPFSAIRELTRIATPDTERAWLADCRGKTVHEIEQRVAGRLPGSSPDQPARPDLATRPLTFEHLKPSTLGVVREARAKAQAERGHHVSDDELLALVFGAFLEGNAARPTTARYQVATVVCERCNQGWRDAHGRRYAMDASEVERALCDAQHIGSLTAPRARAAQDIAPRTRRFVWRRDGGRCRVPGCRSAAHLELHHIVGRAQGGTHEAENLMVMCDGCHSAHHRGLIEIHGTSSALVVERVALANFDRYGDLELATVALITPSERTPIERDLDASKRYIVEPSDLELHHDQELFDFAGSIDRALAPSDDPMSSAELSDVRGGRAMSVGTGSSDAPGATSWQRIDEETARAPSARVARREPRNGVGTPQRSSDVNRSAPAPHAMVKHIAPRPGSRPGSRTNTLAPSRFQIESIRADARAALVGLGFRRAEAATAVDHALMKLGSAAPLEAVIREALRSSSTVKPSPPTR